jgi:hypothetical protein
MPLVSMKTKDDYAVSDSLGSEMSREYGYGTCICLNDEQVRALGLQEPLPEPGTTMPIQAMVTVVCTDVHKDGGGPEYRLSLQITEMSVEPAQPDTARLLYGG